MKLTLVRAAQRVVGALKPDFDQPDWRPILRRARGAWRRALDEARHGPRVLVATAVGGHLPSTTLESLVAVALTLRGANVHLLLCDERLPACLRSHVTAVPSDDAFVREGPQTSTCILCYASGAAMYQTLGLQVHKLSALVTTAESDEARAVASRLPSADIPGVPARRAGRRRARPRRRAALLRARDAPGRDQRGRAAPLPRGCAPQRSRVATPDGAREVRGVVLQPRHLYSAGHHRRGRTSTGIRVVNWNPAYRKQSFIFSHGDTYHHTLMDEPTSELGEPAVESEARGRVDGVPAEPLARHAGLDLLSTPIRRTARARSRASSA